MNKATVLLTDCRYGKLTFILIFDALEIYKGSIKRSDCVFVERESPKIC